MIIVNKSNIGKIFTKMSRLAVENLTITVGNRTITKVFIPSNYLAFLFMMMSF